METIKQAIAPKTHKMQQDDFKENNATVIRWLGSAGIHINSHGTNIMIDPVLQDFDMPLFQSFQKMYLT